MATPKPPPPIPSDFDGLQSIEQWLDNYTALRFIRPLVAAFPLTIPPGNNAQGHRRVKTKQPGRFAIPPTIDIQGPPQTKSEQSDRPTISLKSSAQNQTPHIRTLIDRPITPPPKVNTQSYPQPKYKQFNRPVVPPGNGTPDRPQTKGKQPERPTIPPGNGTPDSPQTKGKQPERPTIPPENSAQDRPQAKGKQPDRPIIPPGKDTAQGCPPTKIKQPDGPTVLPGNNAQGHPQTNTKQPDRSTIPPRNDAQVQSPSTNPKVHNPKQPGNYEGIAEGQRIFVVGKETHEFPSDHPFFHPPTKAKQPEHSIPPPRNLLDFYKKFSFSFDTQDHPPTISKQPNNSVLPPGNPLDFYKKFSFSFDTQDHPQTKTQPVRSAKPPGIDTNNSQAKTKQPDRSVKPLGNDITNSQAKTQPCSRSAAMIKDARDNWEVKIELFEESVTALRMAQDDLFAKIKRFVRDATLLNNAKENTQTTVKQLGLKSFKEPANSLIHQHWQNKEREQFIIVTYPPPAPDAQTGPYHLVTIPIPAPSANRTVRRITMILYTPSPPNVNIGPYGHITIPLPSPDINGKLARVTLPRLPLKVEKMIINVKEAKVKVKKAKAKEARKINSYGRITIPLLTQDETFNEENPNWPEFERFMTFLWPILARISFNMSDHVRHAQPHPRGKKNAYEEALKICRKKASESDRPILMSPEARMYNCFSHLRISSGLSLHSPAERPAPDTDDQNRCGPWVTVMTFGEWAINNDWTYGGNLIFAPGYAIAAMPGIEYIFHTHDRLMNNPIAVGGERYQLEFFMPWMQEHDRWGVLETITQKMLEEDDERPNRAQEELYGDLWCKEQMKWR